MTDFRALCARMAHELDHYRQLLMDDRHATHALAAEARAALAQREQPVSERRPVWTEGICGDGAAILKDGVMQPIEDVVAALNATSLAQPEPQGSATLNWSEERQPKK